MITESADVFDDLGEFVHAVTLPSSELDELSCTLDDERDLSRVRSQVRPSAGVRSCGIRMDAYVIRARDVTAARCPLGAP